ncbi:rhomboid family intramembrane serine protease [Pseudomaricurvus alkylphenolicus]|jgi:membrane associated rhomboid family serine protease|uniref:rhomboid family intramembrane serine protease n=1 Tax=Pseudomaricurvus alkylphenolicus TaxID=1306991 RepID=UPI00141FE2B1|nr:rhomboid family intramembrane serine protease [Pseudomaricurvus alkylphenolicus]NIB44956.1 rhomboid family intramembrane serine protease [Pseudomaricurvus alkylphenolicus]
MIILPTEKRLDWQRAPVVLCLLVAINIFAFLFYQSGDDPEFEQALHLYQQQDLLELEWPIFQQYLTQREETQTLEELQELYQDAPEIVSIHVLLRVDFYRYLHQNYPDHMSYERYDDWAPLRKLINQHIESVSYVALGLNPQNFNPVTLLTHQFLHGDIMHLLGNLFFLVICGFAVEAAIGHRWFLLFYLLSGVAGGLLHWLFNPMESASLIGASGAISGVMAMYLGVFRLKKIEFFYWFFIFVGYIRAPALVILPFYIGKELYSFYTDTGSNVAFMAHTGGFLMGAALIALTLWLQPQLFDQEYIEEDQDQDPYREALAAIYTAIGRFQFPSALKQLNRAIDQYDLNFELAALRSQLAEASGHPEHKDYLLRWLTMPAEGNTQIQRLETLWKKHPQLHDHLNDEQRLQLGLSFVQLENPVSAETLFKQLTNATPPPAKTGLLAKKLAQSFAQNSNREKQQYYARQARDMMQG